MKGYFIVYKNKENETYDIKCELHPEHSKEEVPEVQQQLYLEVEDANNVIKSLHNTKDDIKIKYFNKLLTLTQAGLVGETAQPQLAQKSLEKLQEEIILLEGQRIKNTYMKQLGINALIITSICIALGVGIHYIFNTEEHIMYFITWVGAMLGTWISFGARKFVISFKQLSMLEEDMMNPYIRLCYIGACSIVFLLLLNTGIFSIQLGNISTEDIRNNFEIQAVIGILCGLVESKIGINIYKKAVTIMGDV